MLERRLTDAAQGVREALGDLVPPPITDLVGTPHSETRRQTGSSPVWRGPLIAVGTAVAVIAVVGVSLLMLRGGDSFDIVDEPTPTTVLEKAVATTTVAPTTTVMETPTTIAPMIDGVVPGLWDPILATTKAAAAPPAATCPEGATPDVLGSVGQSRPWGASWSNQAAVFDQHAGRLVFVDEVGETWTFDVCTNTWQAMNPSFDTPGLFEGGWSGQLVYDVDSDLTISFLGGILAVYDAESNSWTSRPQPDEYDTGMPGSGAGYDPVSGLVVVQTASSGLVAYDVETDTWTPLGGIEDKEYPSYLVGYLPATDRFVFLNVDDDRGMTVNPRTGATAELAAPFDDMFAGFGRLNFATNTDTVYVLDGPFCRLNPESLEWDCLSLADRPRATGNGAGLLAAIVGEPINDRVVLIYGYGDGFNGARYHTVNDIWAVDFDTGEWTQLLERTGEMTYEEEIDDSWVHPETFGIEIALSPSTLPSVPGDYDVEVYVWQSEAWTLPWACPGLGGNVEPDISTDILDELCVPLVSNVSETVTYPIVVTVTLTDEIIAEGGLVIAANAAGGSWAGTALLPVRVTG